MVGGKLYAAALVGLASLGMSSVAHAAAISFGSNNVNLIALPATFSSTYTGSLSFSLLPSSTLAVNIDDQLASSPFGFSVDGTGSVIGKWTAFSANMHLTNGVVDPGGNFTITVTDLLGNQAGTVTGDLSTATTGGVGVDISGGASNASVSTSANNINFTSSDMGGMNVGGFFLASPFGGGSFDTAHLTFSLSPNDTQAHFELDASIPGASSSVPLPATFGPAMILLGGIAVFAKTRRKLQA